MVMEMEIRLVLPKLQDRDNSLGKPTSANYIFLTTIKNEVYENWR
jgi:hypothetical protein